VLGYQKELLENYSGSTVLVTGGLGFLGSALVTALSSVRCRIVLLVRPGSYTDFPRTSEAERIAIHGDIQTPKPWLQALKGVDYVFHFAAQTSASVANEDPLADFSANVTPVLQMMETCRQQGLKPSVLFSGAVTQMGLSDRLPVDESFPDHPVIVYDIHKLMAEKYLQYYSADTGIPTVTLRLANVYGPGMQVSSQDRGVLNLMMRRALEGETLTVYGTGEQVRDYIYVDDVIRAFLTAGAWAQSISGNYYVIGSGTGFRIVDAINMVADRAEGITGRRPTVAHVTPPTPLPAIEERDFVANTQRFQSATGWDPLVSLADGIDRTMNHYLESQRVEQDALD